MRYRLLGVIALGFLLAGCGSQHQSEPLEWSAPEPEVGAQQENGPTRFEWGLGDQAAEARIESINEKLAPHGARLVVSDNSITLWLPNKVTFDFDAAKLDQHVPSLDALAIFMSEAELSAELVGHADAPGEPEYNQQLGFDRAEAAMLYLIQQGVYPFALQIDSAGENNLLVSTQEPERKNRRLEIELEAID